MRLADNELEVFNEVLEQMMGSTTVVEPGKTGEEAMKTWFTRPGSSWQFVALHEGKSTRRPGPDGLAWRLKDGKLELLLLDNKQYSKTGNIGKASGLTDKSLVRNIGPILVELRDLKYRTRQHLHAVRGMLVRTWLQLVNGLGLPVGVTRVITNAEGMSTGITRTLDGQKFLFMDLAGRVGGVPPPMQELFGFGPPPAP
jgi:hypothetical protein